jgi:protein-disulfide isomerase
MNTKRIFFWACFIIILVLVIWGLIVAMNKQPVTSGSGGTPPPVTTTDHVRGSATAPVTLIEYSDYQCPACEAYYPMVEQLWNESSSSLRMVYRNFPLPQHPNAVPAAVAAEAAANQGKFWEMYGLIFQNHLEWQDLSDPEPVFVGYAGRIGLSMDKFKADVANKTGMTKIQADQDGGNQIGIDATPTFFVNGTAIANPQSYEQFKALIDAAAAGSSR